MEANDLLWMVPAYIGGGLLTVYVAACNGRLTEAEEVKT